MTLIRSASWQALAHVQAHPIQVQHTMHLFEAAAAFVEQEEGQPLIYPLGACIMGEAQERPACIEGARVLTVMYDSVLVARRDCGHITYFGNHATWQRVGAYLLEELRLLHLCMNEGEAPRLKLDDRSEVHAAPTMVAEFKTNANASTINHTQFQRWLASIMRDGFLDRNATELPEDERAWGPRDQGPRWEVTRPGRIDQNPCGEIFAGSLGTVPTTVPTTYSSDDIDPAVYSTTGVVIRDGVAVPASDGERPEGYVIPDRMREAREATREQAINLLRQNAHLLREMGITLDTSEEEEEPGDTSGDFIEAVVASSVWGLHNLTAQDASGEDSDDNPV